MAQRRMFSPDIVSSDAFLDMPVSSQVLYFHLGMAADDDGFVNPKRVMRAVGVGDDDLKVLLAKRFLLSFDDGVVVIKHWLIHNLIRHDRYKPTQYIEHRESLKVKQNKAYTELATIGKPNGNQMAPQVRLGKVRLGKVIRPTAQSAGTLGNEVIDLFKDINPSYQQLFKRKGQHESAERLVSIHGLEMVKKVVEFLFKRRGDRFCPSITTPSQLEDGWAKLEKYANSLKDGVSTGRGIISSI